METVEIRDAVPGDGDRLDAALRHLSRDLGDAHRADAALLARACFGPEPAAHALLAEAGAACLGAALYSPVVSTARGGTGVFVSDLWVAGSARGRGLGRRLVAAVAGRAASRWGAVFLRLAVYHASVDARAFYERLGFHPAEAETVMTLSGPAFDTVRGEP